MPKFYHIQRSGSERFRKLGEYATKPCKNPHQEELERWGFEARVAGAAGVTLDALLRDALDPDGMRYYERGRSAGGVQENGLEGLLRVSLAAHLQQAQLLREYVFEEVRQTEFPDKPSRIRGIWLLPLDRDILERWCGRMGSEDYTVWQVEASGLFHYGRERYLRPHVWGGREWAALARKYWGDVPESHEVGAELLFEGKFTVVDKVNIPGSKRPGPFERVKKIFRGRSG